MKKRYCVIGKNIGYSLSPQIHEMIYREWNINAEYDIREIGDLREDIHILRSEYSGFNVTKPLKREIVPFVDVLCSDFDSINTVVNSGGKLMGYNTDYYGFRMDMGEKIRNDGYGTALVLGSGGAAETVVPALKSLGMSVRIESRNSDTKAELEELFGIDKKATFSPEVIVNCTPEDFSLNSYAPKFIYELRYAGSNMLALCASRGIRYSDGLGMLVYQAIAADEIFFGMRRSHEEKKRLYEKIIAGIREI